MRVHFGSIGMARVSDTKLGVSCVKSPDSLITLGMGSEERDSFVYGQDDGLAGW